MDTENLLKIENYGLPLFYYHEGEWWVRGPSTFSKPQTALAKQYLDALLKGPSHYASFLKTVGWDDQKMGRFQFLLDNSLKETFATTTIESPSHYPLIGFYFQLPEDKLMLFKLKYG